MDKAPARNLSALTSPAAVERALDEFDALGQSAFLEKYGFGPSRRYFVRRGEQLYDSKAIAAAAFGFEHPESGPLRSDEFSGGAGTVRPKLEQLGFALTVEDSGGPLSGDLERVLAEYPDARAREPLRGHPMQAAFREMARRIGQSPAIGGRSEVEVKWSVGQGRWTNVPWIAVLNTRLTTTTQDGFYPVYLFRQDGSAVYLALAQGVQSITADLGPNAAIAALRSRAAEMRALVPDLAGRGFSLSGDVELRSDDPRLGPKYEASVIAFKRYDAGEVPDDEELFADLSSAMTAYDRLVAEADGSRTWVVYVSKPAGENLRRGLEKGIWGVERQERIGDAQPGDKLLFVEYLTPDQSPAPGGYPRVADASQMPGTARGVATTVVTKGPFEDHAEVWPDSVYPYRVAFSVLEEESDVKLNEDSVGDVFLEALRRSVVGHGSLELVGKTMPERRELELEDLLNAVSEKRLLIDDGVCASLIAAIRAGKHVMLTGPPGTGKTTLAHLLAELAIDAGWTRGHLLTTATADWTTYETIGGLRPAPDGSLRFSPGLFVQAIERDEWLVIDELNRSNFDRAFGQLFTVLSGQPVVLPYERGSGPIAIVPNGVDAPAGTDDVRTSDRWRIVATINVFDKSLLFEMSFALMRRFAFIEVPSPSEDVFRELIRREAGDDDEAVRVASEMLQLRRLKDLGPAVFIDLTRYLVRRREAAPVASGDLAFEAFHAYLLPQFEGIDQEAGELLYRRAGALVGYGNRDRLRTTLNAVLGLELPDPGAASEDALEEAEAKALDEGS